MHLSAEDFESKAVASTTAHPASHILTNTFTNLYKYILQFGKKNILQFEQIRFVRLSTEDFEYKAVASTFEHTATVACLLT